MTDIRRPVNGAADAVRMLRLQPFRQLDKHALTSYCRNVQILIVCLRRTKTGRPGNTCLQFVTGLIEQVQTGAEDGIVNQVMVIQTEAGQEYKLIHFPFVLHKSAGNAHILFHITVITGHNIVQGVVLILQPGGKSSRRE